MQIVSDECVWKALATAIAINQILVAQLHCPPAWIAMTSSCSDLNTVSSRSCTQPIYEVLHHYRMQVREFCVVILLVHDNLTCTVALGPLKVFLHPPNLISSGTSYDASHGSYKYYRNINWYSCMYVYNRPLSLHWHTATVRSGLSYARLSITVPLHCREGRDIQPQVFYIPRSKTNTTWYLTIYLPNSSNSQ